MNTRTATTQLTGAPGATQNKRTPSRRACPVVTVPRRSAGRWCDARSIDRMASAPELAQPAISNSVPFRSTSSAVRIIGWSSATSTRVVIKRPSRWGA